MYDAVNALVDDERLLVRRGGDASYAGSTTALGTILGVADVFIGSQQRTIVWDAFNTFVVDDAGFPIEVWPNPPGPGLLVDPVTRPVSFRSFVALRNGGDVWLYAGSFKTADYLAGTVTVTNGSNVVTGVGTSWLANVDRGMILAGLSSGFLGVVESVDSNTQIRLLTPWEGPTAAGSAYSLVRTVGLSVELGGVTQTVDGLLSAAGRLIVCAGNRAYFTDPTGGSVGLASTDYHELPGNARILGGEGVGSTGLLFTTEGVWAISNLDLDVLDDVGNIQQSVEQVNKDLVLWGDAGIAAWAGGLLVPAVDDVYAVGADGSAVPVSTAIRPLYREYVDAGYRPGVAAVFRGHYLLPIVDGSNSLVDELVCRLDLRDGRGASAPAWTRWSGHAAGVAHAVRAGASTSEPVLIGVSGATMTDLSGCFVPSALNKWDVDLSAHRLQVVTRDFESGEIPHTCTGARVALELVDAAADNPVFEVEYAAGPVESEVWVLAGWRGESDGESPETFRFARRARAVRLRVTTSGACARAVLRSVGVFFRPRGRA